MCPSSLSLHAPSASVGRHGAECHSQRNSHSTACSITTLRLSCPKATIDLMCTLKPRRISSRRHFERSSSAQPTRSTKIFFEEEVQMEIAEKELSKRERAAMAATPMGQKCTTGGGRPMSPTMKRYTWARDTGIFANDNSNGGVSPAGVGECLHGGRRPAQASAQKESPSFDLHYALTSKRRLDTPGATPWKFGTTPDEEVHNKAAERKVKPMISGNYVASSLRTIPPESGPKRLKRQVRPPFVTDPDS